MSSSSCPLRTDPSYLEAAAYLLALATPKLPDPLDPASFFVVMAHAHTFILQGLETIWEGAEKCEGGEYKRTAKEWIATARLEED